MTFGHFGCIAAIFFRQKDYVFMLLAQVGGQSTAMLSFLLKVLIMEISALTLQSNQSMTAGTDSLDTPYEVKDQENVLWYGQHDLSLLLCICSALGHVAK